MQEHFGFSDDQMEALSKDGVTTKHLYDFAVKYAIGQSEEPIGYINLFYYIDEKGDIEKPPHFPHKKIARMIFENLTIMQKVEVSEYMEDHDNGEF